MAIELIKNITDECKAHYFEPEHGRKYFERAVKKVDPQCKKGKEQIIRDYLPVIQPDNLGGSFEVHL